MTLAVGTGGTEGGGEGFSDPLRRPDDDALPINQEEGASQPSASNLTDGEKETPAENTKNATTEKESILSAQAKSEHAAAIRLLALEAVQVYGYQRLFLSTACRNPSANNGKGAVCEKHEVTRIHFYNPMDLTLSQFITAASPAPSKKCKVVRHLLPLVSPLSPLPANP